MISKTHVIKHAQGYVLDREPVRAELVGKVAAFNSCEREILNQIRTHEADFTCLRVQYMLAKLRTYVGLARISEYPISEAQWLDWFEHEANALVDKLWQLVRAIE